MLPVCCTTEHKQHKHTSFIAGIIVEEYRRESLDCRTNLERFGGFFT